jgi:YggT family protein
VNLIGVTYYALSVYAWMIIGRSLLSWVRPRPGGVLARIDATLVTLTEPYLRPFRRLMSRARLGGGFLDFSPMVALVVLFGVMQLVARA